MAFWSFVALHHAKHTPKGGANRPSSSLETKWGDIHDVVTKFNGCYRTIKTLDGSGRTKDDVVLHAMSVYKHKCGKAFVFKH